MSLQKVARLFAVKLAQVSNQTYKGLVDLNNLAKAMAVDPYGEVDPKVMQLASDLSKFVNNFADRAYRTGVSSAEMTKFLSDVKTKYLHLNMANAPENKDVKSELDNFSSKLNTLTAVDVPVQMLGATPKDDRVDAGGTDNAPGNMSVAYPPLSEKEEDPKKLNKVVQDLSKKYDAPNSNVNWKSY